MSASDNESGILVYPRLPVPTGSRSDPRPAPRDRRRSGRRVPIAAIALGVIAGGAGAWFLRPAIAPDPRIAAAAARASDAETTAAAQKTRADGLDRSLEAATKARRDAETKLGAAEGAQSELASKAADEAGQRKAAEAVEAVLKPAIDRASMALVVDGSDVRVRIADRALFKPSDDALTDRGKAMLSKLAATLKELPEQQVAVQGHTDEAPLALPKAPPARGKSATGAAPPVRFASSWELSAARALAVVHYLQDAAKLDPSRLSALAFGPYAPVSKKDRSANRRIELVLAPRRPSK